jgi:hypothetical protein
MLFAGSVDGGFRDLLKQFVCLAVEYAMACPITACPMARAK